MSSSSLLLPELPHCLAGDFRCGDAIAVDEKREKKRLRSVLPLLMPEFGGCSVPSLRAAARRSSPPVTVSPGRRRWRPKLSHAILLPQSWSRRWPLPLGAAGKNREENTVVAAEVSKLELTIARRLSPSLLLLKAHWLKLAAE
nr:hypothetical protein Iba_chr03dCG3130 [Ipomoea batatas]